MDPGYDAVMHVIAGCGLAAVVELANADSSYLHDVDERLRLEPIERLRRLGSERHVEAIRRLAHRGAEAIVIGDVAAALQGWPLILPFDAAVEVCAPVSAEDLDDVVVLERPLGTRGYRDLRRDAELFDVGEDSVRVASLLDLLRIERGRGHSLQAGGIQAVLEHRRRWPDGPRAPRQYTEQEARETIEAWLSRT